ncbi:MAG TPA: hypothetical protein DCR14_17030 [Acidimicrobiaceae bacterium]|nr:hypothetical protein [Acidimicrobiaceae bacterium]
MRPTRRQLLLAAGSSAVLAACGSDSTASTTSSPDANPTITGVPGTDGAEPPAGFGVVQRFPNVNLFTPGEVRLPISLTDGQSLLTEGPAQLSGWITTLDGTRVADVVGVRRDEGISVPYWEIRVQLDRPLIYTLRFPGDDGFGATFEVWEPGDVFTPNTGEAMPPFDTPTVDDHRGVEPYCSLTPEPCPLHDVTLTEALASGKPVVYMVGTPAFCATGTCAPGLEFLVAEHATRGDAVVMVHADVYADDKGTEVAPAIEALRTSYEPIIYFMDATGTIVDRLDGVWDASELRERLDVLLG